MAGETSGGRPVYKKEGGDGWIEYWSRRQQWQVKSEASKGKDVVLMFSHAGTEAGAVEEVTGGWQVVNEDGTSFSVQAGVRVVRKVDAVWISGATGKHAASVNGVYHPVAGEACGGRPVYKKEDGDVWIEYWSG